MPMIKDPDILVARGDDIGAGDTHGPLTRLRWIALLVLPLIVIGCATTQVEHHDWSSYDGPGRRFLESEEVEIPFLNDPLEPTNRALGTVDHVFKMIVFRPLARVYRTVVPKLLRDGIRNAGNNLLYPGRLVNNLLQGDARGAWIETQKFAVNTTIGVAGLFDAATPMGVELPSQDTGRTFREWGWGRSSYLVLPILATRSAWASSRSSSARPWGKANRRQPQPRRSPRRRR